MSGQSELRIKGWHSKNLRIPENQIEINDDCQMTFILIPNGHGKTTTHQLIYYALRNFAAQGADQYIPSYDDGPIPIKQWVQDLKKKFDQSGDGGEFNLFFSYGKKTIGIFCKFDLVSGIPLKTYKVNSKDCDYIDLEMSLRDLIDRRSADFMLVDGEQADTFVRGSSDSSYSPFDVISVMHRLNELQYIKDRYMDHYADESKAEGKKGGKAQKTQSQNRLTKATQRLKDRKKEKSDLADEILENDAKILKLNLEEKGLSSGTSYDAQIQVEVGKEASQYERRDEYNKQANGIFTTDLLSINPGFEKPIKDLWNCLETCKLPENAAKDWFIDLADKKICVCGREINAFESKQIKDHADNFLSGNHQNQLNQIKESIRDFCDGPKDIDEPSENIQGKLDKSAKSYADGRTHRDEANRLKGLAAKELDTTARRAEIINELATFGQEKLDLEDNVKILGDIKTELGSIAWAENEETLAKDDFRSHKKMYSLYAKSELLKDLFEYLENHVLMKICKGIVVRTNKSISNMIGNKTMNIREIGADRLILESGSPKGSKGQNLALGYSFLEAVYSPMDFSLPLIIDSPFGKIDSFIRPDIAKMLWKLDRQMIILLIDTEKEAFLPKIKELAKKDKKENKIEYITQFNITDKTKHVAGKLSGANLVSGNDPESYLTKNEKAFEEFMNLGEFDPVEVKN